MDDASTSNLAGGDNTNTNTNNNNSNSNSHNHIGNISTMISHSTTPLPFLHPTAKYQHLPSSSGREDGVYRVWRSRDNRKGRHAAVVTRDAHRRAAEAAAAAGGVGRFPRATNSVVETARGVGKMFTRFPVWDISYDVAVVFTLGSVVWVFNGFFEWLPLAAPSTEFPGETATAGGLTAFIGATIFEIGSVLMMMEAVNENRTDCFGWALEEVIEDHTSTPSLHITPEQCHHRHHDRRSWLKRNAIVIPGAAAAALMVPLDGTSDDGNSPAVHGKVKAGDPDSSDKPGQWIWWPSPGDLRTHYLRELGFLACLSQMIGATVFWISGFTALKPVSDALSPGAADGVFWLPQVVGGSGFVVSSCLLMLEVQTKWYVPEPRMLGWHVGFWNLVGAVGFTLCGALGFGIGGQGEGGPVEYASTLATFIGSWAFLIGSVIQWYESLDKYPISVEDGPF